MRWFKFRDWRRAEWGISRTYRVVKETAHFQMLQEVVPEVDMNSGDMRYVPLEDTPYKTVRRNSPYHYDIVK